MTDKASSDYIPLCDAHAESWFTARDHLYGGLEGTCVVCAFTIPAAPVALTVYLHQQAQSYLVRLLQKHNGHVTTAAQEAGRNRTEFYRLLAAHGIDQKQFRLLPVHRRRGIGYQERRKQTK